MTIKEIQDSIVEDFSMFDDWMDRYAMLIEMGKECPIIDDQYRNDQYLINGCQSRVWLHAELKDGKVYFTADSDAVITKGIINLLIKVFSGQTPEDILAADLSFLDEIGLKEHLSPTRSNGLLSMLKQLRRGVQKHSIKKIHCGIIRVIAVQTQLGFGLVGEHVDVPNGIEGQLYVDFFHAHDGMNTFLNLAG